MRRKCSSHSIYHLTKLQYCSVFAATSLCRVRILLVVEGLLHLKWRLHAHWVFMFSHAIRTLLGCASTRAPLEKSICGISIFWRRLTTFGLMKMLPLKKLFRETFSQLDDSKTNIKRRDEKHFNFLLLNYKIDSWPSAKSWATHGFC